MWQTNINDTNKNENIFWLIREIPHPEIGF